MNNVKNNKQDPAQLSHADAPGSNEGQLEPYVRKAGVPQADNWRPLRSICAHYLGFDAVKRLDEAYDFASTYHK